MYSFCKHRKNKTKKEKEKERPRRSACYGHRKHKSFVESKHIFWKQETDAKIIFQNNRDENGWIR